MLEFSFKKWLEEVGAGINGLEAPRERPELFVNPTHHGCGSKELPPTPQNKKRMPMKKKQRKS